MVNIPYIWTDKEESEGIDFNLIAKRTSQSRGIDITGGYREGNYASGIQITAGCNNIEASEGFLLQIGGVNRVEDVYDEGTVIQIGLYNEAGPRKFPLINIVGLRNLPNLIREGLGLEGKV